MEFGWFANETGWSANETTGTVSGLFGFCFFSGVGDFSRFAVSRRHNETIIKRKK